MEIFNNSVWFSSSYCMCNIFLGTWIAVCYSEFSKTIVSLEGFYWCVFNLRTMRRIRLVRSRLLIRRYWKKQTFLCLIAEIGFFDSNFTLFWITRVKYLTYLCISTSVSFLIFLLTKRIVIVIPNIPAAPKLAPMIIPKLWILKFQWVSRNKVYLKELSWSLFSEDCSVVLVPDVINWLVSCVAKVK